MTTVIDRGEAVRDIAARLADRTAYVIAVPPALSAVLGPRLDVPHSWTAYIDAGLDTVMQTRSADALGITTLLVDSTVVVVVPKTVPASVISEMFGRDVPADGSLDILLIRDDAASYCWPHLFLDALKRVDPAAVAQIYATAAAAN